MALTYHTSWPREAEILVFFSLLGIRIKSLSLNRYRDSMSFSVAVSSRLVGVS